MIVPFANGPSATTLSPDAASSSRFKMVASKISELWFAVQITHYGGKYSLERMLALEEYTRNTSLLRVLMVIIITPLPTITIVLCQESIPLQNPVEGWSANWGFWIRMAVLGIGESFGTILQSLYLLDVTLSWRKITLISFCVGLVHTAVVMVVAAYFAFPVPFVSISLGMVFFAIFVVVFRASVGGQMFRQILSQKKQLQQCSNFFSVQMTMVCVYPAFQVLFNAVKHTNYELPVLLLLPVMKLILKNIFTFTIMHKEDTIPEQVIFTVDFFDALYLAICLQSISSLTTVAVIMTTDIIQAGIDLYELQERTERLLAKLRIATGTDWGDDDLLTLVRRLCLQSKTLQIKMRQDIQVRSCIRHQLSSDGKNLLEKLDQYAHHQSTRRSSSIDLSKSIIHAVSKTASTIPIPPWHLVCKSIFRRKPHVQPKEFIAVTSIAAAHKQIDKSNPNLHDCQLLHETLEVLFTTECVILTEFLEMVIPFYYAQFVLVMAHLPSAKYHREMIGVTPENVIGVVRNVLIYAMLEIVSFVAQVIVMRRNCGIRPLYHLAFVLETQTTFVHSKLILWVITTLAYCVFHFGADFTFRFAWVGH